MPEYDPADVAMVPTWQSISPGLDSAIDPLVDAYLRGYVEATGKRATEIAYSRTGLAYVREAVLASNDHRAMLKDAEAKIERQRKNLLQL